MNTRTSRYFSVADLLLAPFIYPSAWLLKFLRRLGVERLPRCKNALLDVGVFPVRDHYYEPQFDYRKQQERLAQTRALPGIDWNISGQLQFLSALVFAEELEALPIDKPDTIEFYVNNSGFGSGDAEYWYQLIRAIKPARVFEVGSGNSTLMAIKAIQRNREEDPKYSCKHVCIEPYEMPWLERTGVSVIRKKVEDLDPSFFVELEENDIFFVDSSHIIRPRGDVLFEYLEILPALNKGVVVHLHDIFSPHNYPTEWLSDRVMFWNEQYLLEAFLTHNSSWRILGALNYLQHNHHERLKSVAPFLTQDREPASFYIQKVR